MRLLNLAVAQPIQAIALRALGLDWDLHAFAEFTGVRFNPSARKLDLEWTVPPGKTNPWGDARNSARGCRLRFRGVRQLRVELPSPELPLDFMSLSRVVPGEPEFRFRETWGAEDPFNLLLQFNEGGEIEIAAESAELEPIP